MDDFENNKTEIIQTVLTAALYKDIPFSVFKVTGLGRTSLIKKVSLKRNSLTKEENLEKDQIVDRIDQICKVAYDKNVSIFIDAEDSWFQDFIDDVEQFLHDVVFSIILR